MTSNTNLTHAECQQRATTVAAEDYRIQIDLSHARDPQATTFRSISTITFSATGDTTWVDLIGERVVSATLNGTALDVSAYDGARLPLSGLAERNELTVEAVCVFSRSGEGLHRFTDPVDGNTYLYTHFEPTEARRLYANFEQPDLKATFTFVVTAPEDWQIVSGQPEAGRTVDDGMATVTFTPTPPLSTYITAIAAGPYHRAEGQWSVQRADGSSQQVALGALCRQSMAEHFEPDAIFAVTQQGLDFFDDKFAYPYPWGKYDQIFVPEYNLGAMENPGLVTFTESFIHRGAATEAQRESRAEVILHEMAHMWFGDLVTMQWWDGLWLKESFADLMGYHVCEAATEFKSAWTTFASGRKPWAYRQDQLPTTHPIVATIDDLEGARQNFDGITYAKGAAALKQLMAYVGADAFFAGAKDYFAAHAFGNTTLDDLLTCLEKASGRDLKVWSTVWLETAGTSELTPLIERDEHGTVTRLTIAQVATDPVTGASVARPHRLVVGLYDLVGDRLVRASAQELDVTGAQTPVEAAVGTAPALVLINDDDLTYAKVRLDAGSLRAVRDHLSTIEQPLSRGLVWSALWNAARDAVLPAADYLDIALAQVAREPDAALGRVAAANIRSAIEHYLPAGQRERARARFVDTCVAALRDAQPGSDSQLSWARSLTTAAASTAHGTEAVRGLLDGSGVPQGLTVDADLRWQCWTALAATGSATVAELDEQLAQDDTMTGRTAYVQALASRPDAAAKRDAWQRMTGDLTVTNDHLRALALGFMAPGGEIAQADYVEPYFASLTTWWSERTETMATVLARLLFPGGDAIAGTAAQQHPVVVRAQRWLDEEADASAALRRTVVEGLDDLLRTLRAQAA